MSINMVSDNPLLNVLREEKSMNLKGGFTIQLRLSWHIIPII